MREAEVVHHSAVLMSLYCNHVAGGKYPCFGEHYTQVCEHASGIGVNGDTKVTVYFQS